MAALQVLLGLGQHVRTLKLQGRMSALAMAGHPSWVQLLPLIFRQLANLQAFEASVNAADLVAAVEAMLVGGNPGGRKQVASQQLHPWTIVWFDGIWVAIETQTRAFRGGYRTVAAAMASLENTLRADTD
jgi:hypothetical protein